MVIDELTGLEYAEEHKLEPGFALVSGGYAYAFGTYKHCQEKQLECGIRASSNIIPF